MIHTVKGFGTVNKAEVEFFAAAAAAKSLHSCPTLCNPIDGSPPSSLVPGIFQARVLEWGAIAFSEIFFETEVKNFTFGSKVFLELSCFFNDPADVGNSVSGLF